MQGPLLLQLLVLCLLECGGRLRNCKFSLAAHVGRVSENREKKKGGAVSM